MDWEVERIIEIIDLVNDGKWWQVKLTMGEAFKLKEYLYLLRKDKSNGS